MSKAVSEPRSNVFVDLEKNFKIILDRLLSRTGHRVCLLL